MMLFRSANISLCNTIISQLLVYEVKKFVCYFANKTKEEGKKHQNNIQLQENKNNYIPIYNLNE